MFEIIRGGLTEQAIAASECGAHVGEIITLQGHVHRIRRMRGFAFVLLRTRHTVIQTVYAPERAAFSLDALREEAAVRLEGRVVAEPRSKTGFEVQLLACTVLSEPAGEPPVVLGGKVLDLSLDTLLDARPASLRHPTQRAIFRIQAALANAFAAFLTQSDFVRIHTPKLVATGAEGGANVFALDYFGQPAYLTQSPQLYKQMMVGVYERVFEIGPVFRAEKHDTARHLNEYISVDVERGFIESFTDVMRLELDMLRFALNALPATCAEELALLDVNLPVIEEIPSIRFADAKALVAEVFRRAPSAEMDLEPEEERLLCAHVEEQTGSPFVFITHYPSAKRPFYAMETPGDPAVTESFDLLFRGLEVTTGGQRIHGYAEQMAKMQRLGMQTEPFAPYLLAHQTGLPPHGGFGLGLERFTARLLDQPNVRQSTLFPRDRHRLTP